MPLKVESAVPETWVQSVSGGTYPGGGDGYPFQDSCLENSKDRGAWQAAVHGVTKTRTRLGDFHPVKQVPGFVQTRKLP